MLDAAVKALSQLTSPPFRAVLLKSAGLALVLIILIGVGLHRLLAWLATSGADWLESVLGANAHTLLSILTWILSIAAGLGVIVGSVVREPAATAVVGIFLLGGVALRVERPHHPGRPVGRPPPAARPRGEGKKTPLPGVPV